MAKGDDIEERLIDFAVGIIRLCDTLPKTQVGNHIGGQLLRSGTSPAANYGEARGAESTRDFVHKMRIAQKELYESRNWLKIVARSASFPDCKHQCATQEVEELCRIISASIRTARKRL